MRLFGTELQKPAQMSPHLNTKLYKNMTFFLYYSNKHKKLSKTAQSEMERRLSTMAEVEEDDPSVKVCISDTKF